MEEGKREYEKSRMKKLLLRISKAEIPRNKIEEYA